ncbi:nitrite reductase, partial [Nannochloropsis gaditana]
MGAFIRPRPLSREETLASPRFTTPPSTSTATRTEDQVMGGLATTMEGSQHFPRPPPMELPPDVDQLFGPVTKTGTDYLPAETLARAEKGSFMEKIKLKKDGSVAWREVHELAALLRSGQYTWEELDLMTDKDDMDQRLKYAGIFHRRKKTPGRFMMRMRIPNGVVTSEQLFFIAEAIAKYGEDYEAVVDITTRQNLQLRGLKLEDTSEIITGLLARGLGCYSSGLDNVRNVVGNPLAGIDPLEIYDTRELCTAINDMITNHNLGNPEWANLPRKFNIAVSGSRDDYSHTHINDIGFQAVPHAASGIIGFNVVLGGYFSAKRVATSLELDLWVPPGQVLNLCYSVLRLFRDHGNRKDRQKARLLWLIEEWGVETFRRNLLAEMQSNTAYGAGAGETLPVDVAQAHAGGWERV